MPEMGLNPGCRPAARFGKVHADEREVDQKRRDTGAGLFMQKLFKPRRPPLALVRDNAQD